MAKWILILLTNSFVLYTHASWFGGGSISVRNVGVDSFEVLLKIHVDCQSGWGDSTVAVHAWSTCGQSINLNLNKTRIITSGGPDGGLNRCSIIDECNNPRSALPGFKTFWFKGTAALKPSCKRWNIDYSPPYLSSRNLINVLDSGVFLRTWINTQGYSTNSTPQIRATHFVTVCKDFPTSYSAGAADPDADSLSYSFVCLKKDSLNCETYRPGYSESEPIPGINIDPITGQISFQTSLKESFGLGVKITEYDATGRVKSTSLIEIQFRAEDCRNTSPVDTLGILNFRGNGSLGPENTIENLCLGDSFSFDIIVWDPEGYHADTLDTLLIYSNVENILPAASFAVDAISDSVHRVTISWRVVPTGSKTQSFFIETSDDACPIPGFTTSQYTVTLKPSLKSEGSKAICKGDTVSINITDGGKVTWKALYGDSIINGVNFSCDSTCSQSILWPQNTTLYAVEGDLNNSCNQKDTFKVTVAENFQLMPKPDFEFCFGADSVDLWVKALPDNANYRFIWPNAIDSSFTRAELFRTWGDNEFVVRVVNDSGCTKTAVILAKLRIPNPHIVGSELGFVNETEEYIAVGGVQSSFQWFAEGATIASVAGKKILVRFKDTVQARVGVVETDTMGCENQIIWKEVELNYLGMQEKGQELNVYPNPTRSRIFLNSNELIKRVSVINLLGVELISQKVETKSCEVDLKVLPSGIYFIDIQGDSGSVIKKIKKL